MADIYIFIVGLDGNLWRAEPPFGVGHIPPKRVQVDTTVQVFGRDQGQDVSFPAERSIFVFNQNSLMVLGSDLNLWLEHGPFGKLPWVESTKQFPPPPGQRWHIDGNVIGFLPCSPAGPFLVLGATGDSIFDPFNYQSTALWLENPDWHWRVQIDGNCGSFGVQPNSYSAEEGLTEVFVLGSDGALWQEFGPYGTVPLPTCSGSLKIVSDIERYCLAPVSS